MLFGVEWPALLLGAVGTVVALRRPTLLRLFLVWAFVLSFAIYSWAGEKFAWLVLHPLLPLLLLAGIGVQAIWETRRTWYGAVGLAATAAAFAYAGYASFLVNAEHRADPRELLVSTQSSEEVARVADSVVAKAERAKRADQPFTITVDSAEGATFPWAWYFRDLSVSYADLSAAHHDAEQRRGDHDPGLQRPPPPRAAGLHGPRVPVPRLVGPRLRRDVPERVGRWFTDRKPWNPTGGMSEWLYERP